MLNLLFRILAVVTAFILIVLLIGSMMPRSFSTTSSVVVEAPAEAIFPQVNTIRMWANWSMWNEHGISDLKVNYSGAESGVGAVQKWTELRGDGKLWITESLPNELVKFTSVFANFPEMQSSITLTPCEGGTKVEWTSDGSLPSGPFYGWFGMTFSDSLAREYKKSLESLKRQCETAYQQASDKAPEVPPEESNEANEAATTDDKGSSAKTGSSQEQ